MLAAREVVRSDERAFGGFAAGAPAPFERKRADGRRSGAETQTESTAGVAETHRTAISGVAVGDGRSCELEAGVGVRGRSLVRPASAAMRAGLTSLGTSGRLDGRCRRRWSSGRAGAGAASSAAGGRAIWAAVQAAEMSRRRQRGQTRRRRHSSAHVRAGGDEGETVLETGVKHRIAGASGPEGKFEEVVCAEGESARESTLRDGPSKRE